jgi:hypothetical protein
VLVVAGVADELADELAPELADELAPELAPDVGVEHVALVIVSFIKVTLPFRASARPFTVTPLFMVMDARARMVPANVEPEPRVAELVTCQKTLQGLPPLMKSTRLAEAVMRSDGAWKIQTELGTFPPSRVSVPVRLSVEAAL